MSDFINLNPPVCIVSFNKKTSEVDNVSLYYKLTEKNLNNTAQLIKESKENSKKPFYFEQVTDLIAIKAIEHLKRSLPNFKNADELSENIAGCIENIRTELNELEDLQNGLAKLQEENC